MRRAPHSEHQHDEPALSHNRVHQETPTPHLAVGLPPSMRREWRTMGPPFSHRWKKACGGAQPHEGGTSLTLAFVSRRSLCTTALPSASPLRGAS